MKVAVNPTGELPAPANIFAAMEAINKKEGFQPTEADEKIIAAHGSQLDGHFLVDRGRRSGWPTWRSFLATTRSWPPPANLR